MVNQPVLMRICIAAAMLYGGSAIFVVAEEQPGTEAFPKKIGSTLESFYQLSPQVYSSGQPQGDKDFSALAKLGIKVIISVDGVVPDVEGAKKHGIRSFHLPMGYNGVPKQEVLK